MPNKRIVITGLGIISPNGIGVDDFSRAVFNGESGIKPITLFDTADFKAKTAGEVINFEPAKFLGDKGLRVLDRSTKLLNSAARLALDDAGLDITEENSRETGVVIGTNLGSLKSISDYDREAILEGPRYVNPALFPNTVVNAPASQVSIRFNIKGFNVTISTGFTSGLESINYALNAIRLGRAKTVLAGAVEELCIQTFIGFYKLGCLAGTKNNSIELSCPFDKRRNGLVFGEGSCVLVLEDLDSALYRNAKIYAEVKAGATAFEPAGLGRYNLNSEGLSRAMDQALKGSGLSSKDIGYISSAANSTVDADLYETKSIKNIFKDYAKKVKISALKSMLGESFSASASFQVASAALAIKKQIIPPTINYQDKDFDCDLDFVLGDGCEENIDNCLVNAFGPFGENAGLIISKFK